MKDYSQHGESIILKEIIEKIGEENKFCVEFGASDGYWFSNVRMFLDNGWNGLQMDGGSKAGVNGVHKEFITKDNINDLFDKYSVPNTFDILSIDIDGNDYWVWDEINRNPNVVIIEYNSNFDIDTSVSLEYNESHSFDGTHAYSASFKALCSLAEKKGYYLYSEVAYCNLIFINKKFIDKSPSIFDKSLLNLPRYQHERELKNKKFVIV